MNAAIERWNACTHLHITDLSQQLLMKEKPIAERASIKMPSVLLLVLAMVLSACSHKLLGDVVGVKGVSSDVLGELLTAPHLNALGIVRRLGPDDEPRMVVHGQQPQGVVVGRGEKATYIVVSQLGSSSTYLFVSGGFSADRAPVVRALQTMFAGRTFEPQMR